MQIRINEKKNRISIEDAKEGVEYFCPTCEKQLVMRRGDIRIHHFAHCPGAECSDNWHYDDMSEWHIEWQNRFPIENREVVMKHNNEIHRADVFINDTVIEFQHSNISNTEFEERNSFYTSLGYKVIWVFDVQSEFEDEYIYETNKEFVYKWKWAKSTFLNFDPSNKKVSLFLQLGMIKIENEPTPWIEKVVWKSDEGIKCFAVDSNYIYTDKNFYLDKKITEDKHEFSINDLINNMRDEHFVRNFGHGQMYHGCPKSKSGFATSFDEDKNHSSCYECNCYTDYYCCKYPLDYFDIPKRSHILNVKKDRFGLVSEVEYEYNEKVYSKKMPQSDYGAKTIIDLWNECENPSCIICLDLTSGFYAKITKDPLAQQKKYKRVYGYWSNDQFKFPANGQSKIIRNAEKKDWALVWSRSEK